MLLVRVKGQLEGMRFAAGRPGEGGCGNDQDLNRGGTSRDEEQKLEASPTQGAELTGLNDGGNRKRQGNWHPAL